jgi:pyruvate/2-oxoglutarate/acetoin dehydrogenase E1 component
MKFTEAILEATKYVLENQPESFVIGLGVSYPNGADGTMGNLKEGYPTRVLDTPVSEAAVTGAALGSAVTGMRPIVHHGRVEFALFAADQIITQAAKWNYMFGGNYNAPITYRIAVGRQWGNGPQHTQALYSLFGNVTGLKVVIPSSPNMAKQLLISACMDPNPVVFLEPRWLYQITGEVSSDFQEVPLDKARIIRKGKDLTIVSYGDGLLPAYQAAQELENNGISVEIIDLVSINPIDYTTIIESLNKTKKLLTIDTTSSAFSVGRELIGFLAQNTNDVKFQTMAAPNVPCPTATSLTANYYPTRVSIKNRVLSIFQLPCEEEELDFSELHLSPKTDCPYG